MAAETKASKLTKKARKRTPGVRKATKKAKAVADDTGTDIGGNRQEASEVFAYFARYFDQI